MIFFPRLWYQTDEQMVTKHFGSDSLNIDELHTHTQFGNNIELANGRRDQIVTMLQKYSIRNFGTAIFLTI